MTGINTGPLEINAPDLTSHDYLINGPSRIDPRANENTPAVPWYPTQWTGAGVVNKMMRVYKEVLDSMPNKFEAEYVVPNPVRTFRALPSPQLGLNAVVEIDPNSYTGYQGVGGS